MEQTMTTIQDEIKRLESDYRIQQENASVYYGQLNNPEQGAYWDDAAETTRRQLISKKGELRRFEKRQQDLPDILNQIEKLEESRRLQAETVDFYLNHRQDEDLAEHWKQVLRETKRKIMELKTEYGI